MSSESTFIEHASATETSAVNERHISALQRGEASLDRIASVRISHAILPLQTSISDAKVPTGEMLTSTAEHAELIRHRSVDFIQHAPRAGGITPFLKIMALSEQARAWTEATERFGSAA